MEIYVEKRNPERDLDGLCECFLSKQPGLRPVASLHVQQHFELLYCLEGRHELRAGNSTFLLEKGDVALIHPMEAHQTRTLDEGDNRYLVLKFTPEALYAAGQPLYEFKYIFPYLYFNEQRTYVYTAQQLADSQLPELLMRILEERQRQEFGYEMALRAYISQVFLWFLRAWHRTRTTSALSERALRRLQHAAQYIEEHLCEDLKIQEVAQELGMGESTFSRFFSESTGMTFPAWIRLKRLGKAAMLLSQTDLPVIDIAMETGFSTASYLIYCFRRQYGITPNQFRGKKIKTE